MRWLRIASASATFFFLAWLIGRRRNAFMRIVQIVRSHHIITERGGRKKKRREISFEVIAFDFVRKGAPIVDNVQCTSPAHPSVYLLYISGIPDRPQPLTFISFYSRHHNLHYNYFSVLFSRRIMIPLWRVMKLIPSSSFSFTYMHANKEAFYQSH